MRGSIGQLLCVQEGAVHVKNYGADCEHGHSLVFMHVGVSLNLAFTKEKLDLGLNHRLFSCIIWGK